MSEELKSCPLCGEKIKEDWTGVVEFTTHYEQTMDIDCDNCGVSFLIPSDDKDGDIREKAIKAWNTRADNTALIEKIEGMKKREREVGDTVRRERYLMGECDGYNQAIQDAIDLIKENE